MVIIGFLLQDKLKKAQFFEKTFLLADTNMEVLFEKFFLILSNLDVYFAKMS